jgi:hypothetical protein
MAANITDRAIRRETMVEAAERRGDEFLDMASFLGSTPADP